MPCHVSEEEQREIDITYAKAIRKNLYTTDSLMEILPAGTKLEKLPDGRYLASGGVVKTHTQYEKADSAQGALIKLYNYIEAYE